MTKIDFIVNALEEMCGDKCNAEYNPCHAKETLFVARELPLELAKPEQEPCKCIDKFWCATFDRCKRNETN